MTRIVLYIKSEPFQQIEIDLLENDKCIGRSREYAFRHNFIAREYQLKANIQQLKSVYWKIIQNVNFDYSVEVVLQSKMNQL